MKLKKIEEIKKIDIKEIQSDIISLKKELFELRIKKGTRQTFKPHLIKLNRHRLNQLISVEYQKIFNQIN
jgi:large subunit ribosomal protein L29